MKDTTARICRCGAALTAILLLTGAVAEARDLGIEERIEAQKAIERVYYAHQIGAIRPFEEAIPRAALEKKVRTYLKQSAALETFWKTPVTAEMLRKEQQRIDAHTRMRDRLRELYAALGDDPFLIQECLARPALVDRLARNLFADDATFHARERQEAEALRDDLAQGRLDPRSEHSHRSVFELVRVTAVGGAEESGGRERILGSGKHDPLRLVLQPDEFDRYRARLPERVGEIGPLQEEPAAFVSHVVLNRTESEIKVATFVVPKLSWDEWWASVEGRLEEASVAAVAQANQPLPVPESDRSEVALDTNCPAYDTWNNGSLDGAPDIRYLHSAIWTGSVMIVWGGYDGSYLNTGGRYDPAIDSWTPISTTSAPSGRAGHTAVWTGTEMIVWGGSDNIPPFFLNTGGRYNPSSDTWTPTSTTNASSARSGHTAVWTGSLMIVWGGGDAGNYYQSGGRYNPATNTWAPTSVINTPSERSHHTAVWTGSLMIIWGGDVGYSQGTGGRYDPATDTWTRTSDTWPSRLGHTAIWTGTEMIVWGGEIPEVSCCCCCCDGDECCDLYYIFDNTGSRYDPSTDTWTPISGNAPSARSGHTAIWTGRVMAIWGGNDGSFSNTGGLYNPSSDTWTPTSTTNTPSGRSDHTAIWTGSFMVVWGGSEVGGPAQSTGGRYDLVDPSVDDDGDGVTECQGDCNDSNAAIYAGAAEVCDGLDNDCNGTADGFVTHCGVGQCARTASCTAGVDLCIPGSPSAEVCDGLDNNCDQIVDNAPVPVLPPSIVLALFGQTAVLGWQPVPDATKYDIVRGNLGVLLSTGGNFTPAIQACLANDQADTALVLSGSPSVGSGFFYLVRGANCAGQGTYDSGDPAQVGSPDAEIAASPLSCP